MDVDIKSAESPPGPGPTSSTPNTPELLEVLVSVRRETIPTQEERESAPLKTTFPMDPFTEESRLAQMFTDRQEVRSIIGPDPHGEFARFLEQCLQEPALSLILGGSATPPGGHSGEVGRQLVSKGKGKMKDESNRSDRDTLVVIEEDLQMLDVHGPGPNGIVQNEVCPKQSGGQEWGKV